MWSFSRNINAKIDDLIFKLKDPDSSVRESSVRKMIALGKPAVEPLIQYLQHTDKWARLMAATALGKMGDSRAIKPLEQALNDADEGVRYMAQTALNELHRQRPAEVYRLRFNERDEQIVNTMQRQITKRCCGRTKARPVRRLIRAVGWSLAHHTCQALKNGNSYTIKFIEEMWNKHHEKYFNMEPYKFLSLQKERRSLSWHSLDYLAHPMLRS